MLSQDGKLLYSGTGWPREDKRIRIWDVATGELKKSLDEDPAPTGAEKKDAPK